MEGVTSQLSAQVKAGYGRRFKIKETNIVALELLYKRKLSQAQEPQGEDAIKFCNGYREEREDTKRGYIIK